MTAGMVGEGAGAGAFTCNGEPRQMVEGETRLLIEVLREDYGLTGTKLGCGTGDCGACTVLLDGKAVNACLVHAAEVAGHEVTTVEGVTADGVGRILAEELVAASAIQCGICTPGVVVMASDHLSSCGGATTRAQIEVALGGNLCRCTGYLAIVQAITAAAERVERSAAGERA